MTALKSITSSLAAASLALAVGIDPDQTGDDSIFYFRPEQVRVLAERNVRWKPEDAESHHTEDDTRKLAGGILAASGRYDETQHPSAMVVGPDGEKRMNFIHGQQSAAGFHWEADPSNPEAKIPVLRYGFGRERAIGLLNTKPELFKTELERLGLTPQEILDGDFVFTLKCVDRTGTEARLDNILENGQHKHNSDMDWAVVCGALRSPEGSEDKRSATEISKLLAPLKPVKGGAPSPDWVQDHLKLLEMSPMVQNLVHLGVANGGMSVWQAIRIMRDSEKIVEQKQADPNAPKATDNELSEAMLAEQERRVKGCMVEVDGASVFDMKAGREMNRSAANETGGTVTVTITELRRELTSALEFKSAVAQTLMAFIEGKMAKEHFATWLIKNTIENTDPDHVKAIKTKRKNEEKQAAKDKADAEAKAAAAEAEARGGKDGPKMPPKKKGAKVAEAAKPEVVADAKPAKPAKPAKAGGRKPAKTTAATPDEVTASAELSAPDTDLPG